MPRSRTKEEDIKDKERYISAWLHYEKLNFYKRQAEINKYEFSLEFAIERDRTFEHTTSVNKNCECFDALFEEYSCATEWIDNIENLELQSILSQLTSHQQDILFWKFCKGLTQKDISDICGTSSAAISIQFKRIVKKIKNGVV